MDGASKGRLRRPWPFAERNYKLQWFADLFTSLAFEMETLILGWFVLTSTESVVWLTAFGALQFTGTLLAPFLGLAGDRMGHGRLLAIMRFSYLAVAGCVALLAMSGGLTPITALCAAGIVGLVRPSDIGVRNTLTSAILPPAMLSSAIGLNRATADAARIGGALAGAGTVAALGIPAAYGWVMGLYCLATSLTALIRLQVAPSVIAGSVSVWRDLAAGFMLARGSPALLAALWLAWLTNFAAFPISGGLLPHVAKEVYRLDQSGLALLAASFAIGALSGSLTLSVRKASERPGAVMIVAAGLWFSALIVFAQSSSVEYGMALLFFAGFSQSFCMIPMSILLLRSTETGFRGRVMGLRMLSIYGLPLGLLLAGFGISRFGFVPIATVLGIFGLAVTGAIAWRWRKALWQSLTP